MTYVMVGSLRGIGVDIPGHHALVTMFHLVPMVIMVKRRNRTLMSRNLLSVTKTTAQEIFLLFPYLRNQRPDLLKIMKSELRLEERKQHLLGTWPHQD